MGSVVLPLPTRRQRDNMPQLGGSGGTSAAGKLPQIHEGGRLRPSKALPAAPDRPGGPHDRIGEERSPAAFALFLEAVDSDDDKVIAATAVEPATLTLKRLDLKTAEHNTPKVPAQRAGPLLIIFRHYGRIGRHDRNPQVSKLKSKAMVRAARRCL